MASPWKSNFKSLDELLEVAKQHNSELDCEMDLKGLLEPVPCGSFLIPNSLAVHPMEGCDGQSDGSPGELTIRRYDRFAAGGCGLLWVEATAVVPEGRANPRQLWIHKDNIEHFKALVDRMRDIAQREVGTDFRPMIILQLTHSGRYSCPVDKPEPKITRRDPYRDAMAPEPIPSTERPAKGICDQQIISDEELDALQEKYVEAALLAEAAGFDGVDIKACHGYLINELLSGMTREGRYGGSLENRSRFLLETIRKVREKLSDHMEVTTRLGFYDGVPYPYGFGVDKEDYRKPDFSESIQLVENLKKLGVRMINFTMASPYYNPHIGRPFAKPIRGAYEEPEHPVVGVRRLIDGCAEIQKIFPELLLVGTGYSWLGEHMPYVMAGLKKAGKASLFGAGRMSFAYPDFARDIRDHGGLKKNKLCIACSGCTQIMRDGGKTGCTVREPKLYGKILKEGLMKEKKAHV